MRVLFQHPICPFSRKTRLMLSEKNVNFRLEFQDPWERDLRLLEINPAGGIPVLVEKNGTAISDHNAICEYIDEAYSAPSIIGTTPRSKAEARRLTGWFDNKFYNEVTLSIVGEKIIKRMRKAGSPDSRIIRAGNANIQIHMQYLEWLTERKKWLAGNSLTIADIAAAAHISILDYIGSIPWDNYPETKIWYAKMKSRPSFRSILSDRIPSVAPAMHYDDLDF
ncbi:MAG: glutathione S-transferase family protein [Alphaproteobacteria bacterium]|nr:glutathione S-transferase family protein [Alphaproteobacteria bacterium]